MHTPPRPLSASGQRSPSAPATAPESSFNFTSPISLPPQPELQTIQGRPRSRIFVACVQCRSRKIRCDGQKPTCDNCVKRMAANSEGSEIECSYDAAPKRRGPDKKPGARQRTVRGKQTLTQPHVDSALQTNVVGATDSPPLVFDARQSEELRFDPNANDPDGDLPQPRPPQSQLDIGMIPSVLALLPPDLRHRHSGSEVQSVFSSPFPDGFELQGGLRQSISGDRILLPSSTYPSISLSDSLLGGKRKFGEHADGGEVYYQAAGPRPMGHMTSLTKSMGLEQNARQGAVELGRATAELRQAMAALRLSSTSINYTQREDRLQAASADLHPDAFDLHRAAFYRSEGIGAEGHVVPRTAGALLRITPEPSLKFSRQTWWDNLLNVYSDDRLTSSKQIAEDLKSLFEVAQQWLGFINVPLFYSIFHDPISRDAMQPSFVLAALSLSTYLQSSDAEMGAYGRKRALDLRDMAQSSLDASMNAGWIDLELGMAAWIIVQFEVSAHPLHSTTRCESALQILESIIKITGYNMLDKDDPRATRFSPATVPVVPSFPPGPKTDLQTFSDVSAAATLMIINSTPPSLARARSTLAEHCSCDQAMLGHLNPSSNALTPLWVTSPGWPAHWSLAEIHKEQARRLVWNSLTHATIMNADASASKREQFFGFLTDCSNLALLFPGENVVEEGAGKRTVWALYIRSMILWNACVRMRYQRADDDPAKAGFAVQAWIETVVIEKALDAHECSAERALLFFGREYLFSTRMCISWEFRRYIPVPQTGLNPIFNRSKAEEWLVHQASVARLLMQGLHTVTGMRPSLLAKRPSYIWWFMAQANRALTLWTCDKSLTAALDVSLAFIPPIEFLARLWPCPVQRVKYSIIRGRITEACRTAGIPPPANDDPLDLLSL